MDDKLKEWYENRVSEIVDTFRERLRTLTNDKEEKKKLWIAWQNDDVRNIVESD